MRDGKRFNAGRFHAGRFSDNRSSTEAPLFQVSVSGLISNPVFGQTAQIGVPLFASVHVSSDAALGTITWQWRNGAGYIAGAVDATYTPVGEDDLEDIYPVAIPSGTYSPKQGPIHTVRFAQPATSGNVSDQVFERDVAIVSVDLSNFVEAPGAIYALAPSSAALPEGLSLSGAGLLTGTATTLFDPTLIAVRVASSGGYQDITFNLTVADVPGRMVQPGVEAINSTSIRVDRGPAPAANGSPITSYKLRYQESGKGWKSINGVSDEQTVTGMVSGTFYRVQTRATNGVGSGKWSPVGSATTPASDA